MNEAVMYVMVGATVVALGLSFFSLYLRSRYFLWVIIFAGCVGLVASFWATNLFSTDHWGRAVFRVSGYIMFMWVVVKKYNAQVKFFERARAKD